MRSFEAGDGVRQRHERGASTRDANLRERVGSVPGIRSEGWGQVGWLAVPNGSPTLPERPGHLVWRHDLAVMQKASHN